VKFGAMVAPGLAIAVPAGIIAWACFYAAGGKTQGSRRRSRSNVSGVVWVLLANLVIAANRPAEHGVDRVGVVAFCIVMQSKSPRCRSSRGFAGAAVTAASGQAETSRPT